jgi:ATP adenylyltransferase
MSTGYISGTLKFEVLKRARLRCELCGVSGEEKALEADHIVPRNKGGSDDLSNLQALCYSCNAMKRDRDDTDFRERFYDRRERGCLFCEIPANRIVAENELAYLTRDSYPVTAMHSLIIPKRHALTYFDLRPAEISLCHALVAKAKADIEKADPEVAGFNVGMNSGDAAGQSIFHCHIHLIPRRRGDVKKPRGGVRHVIPGKGDY